MKNFDLFKAFAERALGRPLETVAPQAMSGWQAIEALWPFNEVFRPNLEQIRSLPYDRAFETEADEALASLAADPTPQWAGLSAGAWRVLLERHQQAIVVALANEKVGNPVMPVPPGLSEAQRTVAVALFLLHGMKLPYPVADRSGLALPAGSARATLTRH